MKDPAERAASLALRDGDPATARRAVDWYRTHDRLHCGDAITMAADALDAYQGDMNAGLDALLVCDTTEMAHAINQRLHHQRIDLDAPTVAGMDGQRIGVGDVIISRRNDPTVDFHASSPDAASLASVRNGNRWRVAAIDAKTNRVAAERLDDGARVLFDGDYLRDHVGLGYAVTVHSAQGVTADTSHAVLGETTSRATLYVAMTRGRRTNTAHLYQREGGDHEYGQREPDGTHLKSRGDSYEAAAAVRGILANDDQPAVTAHDYAARADHTVLPDRVRSLLDRRAASVHQREATYAAWSAEARTSARSMDLARTRAASRSRDYSGESGIEL